MAEDQDRKARERGAERARRTGTAWGQRPHRRGLPPEPYVRRTRHGEVRLDALQVLEVDGHTVVEVWVGGDTENGDPHFRVVNPPQLVEDPQGPVEVRGRRYREDPVAALAEAVAANGGAMKPRRRSAR